jgi:hypothetical protein
LDLIDANLLAVAYLCVQNLTCEPPLLRDGRVAILLYQQEQQERARRAAEEAEAARLRKIQVGLVISLWILSVKREVAASACCALWF